MKLVVPTLSEASISIAQFYCDLPLGERLSEIYEQSDVLFGMESN